MTRIEEKLTTDKDFYDQWMDLIALQSSQLEEQQKDFPLDYVLKDLSKCGPRKSAVPSLNDAHHLQADSIKIYGELGQLSSYCPSNSTLLQKGIMGPCNLRSSEMSLPSLPSMLELRGAQIEKIESNQLDESLADQARDIGESIRKIDGYENEWKMIVILATIQDGKASETGQTAVEVLSAIEELGKLIPEKTFIVVLRSSGSGIWRDASHQSLACKNQLAQWKVHNKFNYNSVWDQVEIIVEKNYRKPQFHVEVLPLLKDPALTNLPDGVDLSVLGYDCAHFSERGLSLLHLAVWNSLFTRNSARESQFRPTAAPVLCPDPTCPFIRTPSNSDLCIWTGTIQEDEFYWVDYLMFIGVWILLMVLLVIIFYCICVTRRVASEKTPTKAFGASFSSIKFIDEDVV
uniref:SGNH_hydro domain-containing protein n=1 Tax=Caenorhabditis tropicalis TaxID=1561998 RepID=A0A1I7TYC3_9PELO